MDVNDLVNLVSFSSKDKIDFENGLISFEGYVFIFKDYGSNEDFVTSIGSSKLCSIGTHRNLYKMFRESRFRGTSQLKSLNKEEDLYFAGILKTLLPKIKFGGNEILFDIWVFIRTPDNKYFPITFYYGRSGPSIGAWAQIVLETLSVL